MTAIKQSWTIVSSKISEGLRPRTLGAVATMIPALFLFKRRYATQADKAKFQMNSNESPCMPYLSAYDVNEDNEKLLDVLIWRKKKKIMRKTVNYEEFTKIIRRLHHMSRPVLNDIS